MKRNIFLLAIIAILVFPSYVYGSQEDKSQNIVLKAEEILESMKEDIAKRPVFWGFKGNDDLESIVLSEPHRMITTGLISDTNVTRLDQMSERKNKWLFTLDIDGESKAFIEIGSLEGDDSCVLLSFGGMPEEYNKAKEYAIQCARNNDMEISPKIVQYSGFSCYGLVLLDQENQEYILPVSEFREYQKEETPRVINVSGFASQLKFEQDYANAHEDETGYGGLFSYGSCLTEENLLPVKEKKNAAIYYVIAAITFVIVMAVAAFMFHRRKNDEKV